MPDPKIRIINAMVILNEKTISEGGKEWQPIPTQVAIWKQIEEKEPITSVKIEDISETTNATMNELIGLIFMQKNFSKTGLQELVLKGGDLNMRGTLDEDVMQSLSSQCSNLTTLKLLFMGEMPHIVRM